MTTTTTTLCEDCEQHAATVTRIASDDLPIQLCAECDPGPGCRPIIITGTYAYGKRWYAARCPQCGWHSVGSSDTESTARTFANDHVRRGPTNA